ncbi:MAG: VacJ family lipoprotein [Magnetococcales bacterium]|nr:VacJ family lipoprotein [Magnetococcales bacterium]
MKLKNVLMLTSLLGTLVMVPSPVVWANGGKASSATTPGQQTMPISADDLYGDDDGAQVADPLEGWNRFWFGFNDLFYDFVLRPVAVGYSAVIPEGGRETVQDFFSNLTTPVRLVGSVMQGKGERAGNELGRFCINTTLGVLGLFDVAAHQYEIRRQDAEDMGQALGSYGMGEGLYLVWPILGPSTARDSLGLVGDYLVNPMSYYPTDTSDKAAVFGLRLINETSFRMADYDNVRSASVDPYVAFRHAYVQLRREKINK